jgi:SpoVK/Ycf46/Vps4 family AAA+-type ATPase
MMPMRKKLAGGNFDIMNIANIASEIEAPLTMQDFVDATRNISKSVSVEQLKEYDDWMK